MKQIIFIIALVMSTFALSRDIAAQQFNVTPASPILQGEPVAISLTGLPANQAVKIIAERVMTEWGSEKRVLYRAEATFAVGADGTLNTASATPKQGSYRQADPRGLFWSMQPVPGEVAPERKLEEVQLQEIGRASCRERVLWYV